MRGPAGFCELAMQGGGSDWSFKVTFDGFKWRASGGSEIVWWSQFILNRCSSTSPHPPAHPGYNIINFDLPYIFERAKALKVDTETHQWGRIRQRWAGHFSRRTFLNGWVFSRGRAGLVMAHLRV